MANAKLTKEQIEEAMNLREKGWSFERIARKYNVSAKTISWHALKLGVEPPKAPNKFPPVPTQPVTLVDKNGRFIRRFTTDDDARLLELESKGHCMNKIATIMGRKHNSIVGRLRTLARREELVTHPD